MKYVGWRGREGERVVGDTARLRGVVAARVRARGGEGGGRWRGKEGERALGRLQDGWRKEGKSGVGE